MTTEIKDRPGTETEATGQELQPFEFQSHQVRVVVIDGEPWFVLTDLCRVLDHSNPAMVAKRLDEGLSQAYPLHTPGGPQQMTVVSEPGMYEVVIRSNKPEAVAFRRWIISEAQRESPRR